MYFIKKWEQDVLEIISWFIISLFVVGLILGVSTWVL